MASVCENRSINILDLIENVETKWKKILIKVYLDNKDNLDNTQQEINNHIEKWGDKYPIYPPKEQIFNAFNLTSIKETKVVILGQDPYHGEGQAMGLSFSVPDGIKVPPSLRNIYKELSNNKMPRGQFNIVSSGDLTSWAVQGVILLNTALTVVKNKPNSHKKLWNFFTDGIIHQISEECENVVFMLWGNDARKKKNLIDTNKHLILEAVHPSPLSASNGWFGSKHFEKANDYLTGKGRKRIDWRLDVEGE